MIYFKSFSSLISSRPFLFHRCKNCVYFATAASLSSNRIIPHLPLFIFVNMAANTKRNKIGINLLRAAEQEAHLIVTTSRTEKQARLKQVKEEAEKEIAEFRAQMEVDFQFQKKLLESSGESGDSDARLEQETEEKIDHLKKEALRVSADVVSMLLSHVTTVKN